jgi:hypothetical protein
MLRDYLDKVLRAVNCTHLCRLLQIFNFTHDRTQQAETRLQKTMDAGICLAWIALNGLDWSSERGSFQV